MEKSAYWSDAPVSRIASPASSCGSYHTSGIVASVQGTCLSCMYNVDSNCHSAVTSNLRVATAKSEEPQQFAERIFL